MKDWKGLRVSPDGSHHVDSDGQPAYAARFDDVLKFHAPGLAPVSLGEGAWHIHPDGTPAYGQRFRRTFGYYEGRAAVETDNGCHHIEPTGTALYDQRYAWCGNFQGGKSAVREADGEYLHIDLGGRPAYDERWGYAGDYRDGIAVVQNHDGRSTHIDQRGERVHGAWFLDLDVFHKRFARARDAGGWTHVDIGGMPAYDRRFAAVEPFYNGQARVERFDGGLEVIDEDGDTIIELRTGLRSDFDELSADLVGFWRTKAIAVAVQRGVFDALPANTAAVAESANLALDGASRLLPALGELRLVSREGRIWKNTERGSLLRSEDPLTLADAALEYAGPLSVAWDAIPGLLEDEARSPVDVFEEVSADPARIAGHHRMLRSYARHDYIDVPQLLELTGDEQIVDAGGGLGTLAGMLIDAFPGVHVTVLDRPEVVECREREHRPKLDYRAVDIEGPWGLSADVVLLARVLHDRDEECATRILKRARECLSSDGRLLVVEMVLVDDSFAGSLCDLHLRAVTGGRERSRSEFAHLFEAGGFALEKIEPMRTVPSLLFGRPL